MKEIGSLRTSLRLLAVALGLGLQACAPRVDEGNPVCREPARWILLERRYGEITPPSDAIDGKVNPDAVILTFQPLYSEDLAWDVVVSPQEHYVELIGLTPSGPAAPGEIVSATVRVGRAKPDQLYRLTARPSQGTVRIVGETQLRVRGAATALFRFTSWAGGKAGIEVGAQPIVD